MVASNARAEQYAEKSPRLQQKDGAAQFELTVQQETASKRCDETFFLRDFAKA
jgi:hypothetical protein